MKFAAPRVMESLLRDVRFAARGLLRTPGFTVAAVLALALGIGATTAIFSVVHAVLLRSFGWGDETRLVSVYRTFVGIGSGKGGLSVPELYDLEQAQALDSSAPSIRAPRRCRAASARSGCRPRARPPASSPRSASIRSSAASSPPKRTWPETTASPW